jgi:hypothetical protein
MLTFLGHIQEDGMCWLEFGPGSPYDSKFSTSAILLVAGLLLAAEQLLTVWAVQHVLYSFRQANSAFLFPCFPCRVGKRAIGANRLAFRLSLVLEDVT